MIVLTAQTRKGDIPLDIAETATDGEIETAIAAFKARVRKIAPAAVPVWLDLALVRSYLEEHHGPR